MQQETVPSFRMVPFSTIRGFQRHAMALFDAYDLRNGARQT